MMNEEIVRFLNEYVEIPDPQYAVMLKGAWGCGKTFFIQRWIEASKEKGEEQLEWNPIYVSLYGLTSVQQITESINKEIYPWLYSKGAKLIKNILKTASKIALKYDIDADNDGKSEATATYNLDSILLLKGDNKEIKGNKILIFDDFERCNVNFDTLLGYINYFSEHCKCKIIIIGDEAKLQEKESENKGLKFKDFKEKTIGRTFEIKTNINETVDFFIQELSSNNRNLLSENKELIVQIFQASKLNNLRILRQCLNDYNRIVMSLPESYHNSPKYKKIITSLLANFIAVYCEYKSGNTRIAELFDGISIMFNDSKYNQEREKILSKYQFIGIGQGLGILDSFIVGKIVHYLDCGFFDTEYMQQYFAIEDADIESWEHLYDYWRLDNEEYEQYYHETIIYYLEDRYQDLKELFVIISILSVLSSLELVSVSKDEIIAQGKKSINKLMANVTKIEDLLQSLETAQRGLRPIYDGKNHIQAVLWQYFKSIFDERIHQCPNKMSVALENLDDESCERLGVIQNEVVPMKKVLYKETPFFESVNPERVANRIIGLSNEAKNTFYQFLLYRYDRTSNGSEIVRVPSMYMADMPNLKLIGEHLKDAAEHTKLIERFALRQIVALIEKISQKAMN